MEHCVATVLAIAGTVIAYEQWHLADLTNRASNQQAAPPLTRPIRNHWYRHSEIASLQKSLPQTPGDMRLLAVHQEMAVDAEQGLGSAPARERLA